MSEKKVNNDRPSFNEPDNSILDKLIIKEIDMGLYDEYYAENAFRAEGCKRISYCSCDCDRCSIPLFH